MAAPARRGRWLWKLFAWPGIIWLALLFVFPLYVVLALAFGSLDPIFRSPVPEWNPLNWDPTQFQYVLTHIFGEDGFFGPAIVRTVVFVIIASVGCLLISYPVAYFDTGQRSLELSPADDSAWQLIWQQFKAGA